MLSALWFAVKTGILVAIAVWLADRPGMLEFDWQNYHVSLKTGLALVGLLLALLAALLIYRLMLNILYLPKRYKAYLKERRRSKGYKSLTLGLTAVAAGDAKMANYHAHRARVFMPQDKGLSILLEGQAARLRHDDKAARQAFQTLMENKDTAFLGLRGLLTDALERNDLHEAAQLSQQALAMYPRQPWVLRMAYELELRRHNWAQARKLLISADRYKALPDGKARTDRIVLLLQQAEDQKGQNRSALKILKEAWRLDPSFTPAAERLARCYLDIGKKRPARKVLEESWRKSPHPVLLPLWRESAPKKYREAEPSFLGWLEELVALRPDSAESQIAAAEEAVHQGLWGAAEQYLSLAESIQPNPRIYRLWARLEELRGHAETANRFLEQSYNAPPDKVWVCTETGRVYESWSPVALPHGSFNTIVWDYPHLRENDRTLSDRTHLLITAPSGKN